MSEPEPDVSVLTTLWRERGVRPVGLGEAEASASLAASDRALTSGLTESRDGVRLTEDTFATLSAEELVIRRELGRGGMGVVQLAEQRSMRREVAVKKLSETASPGALQSLLKEAWVGALLSHPNIAPVHALTLHEGAPAVLMKRIEGSTWREVLRDPSRLPPLDRDDALGFHLRVLIAVCNAVGHAHARGVLHLDLKPENVMLGPFGEVYVVDWGLAAGLSDEAPQWLPRAREIRAVSGTPDYMAPEIAMAAGERFSARTDVYLLGATLHELVTGMPPHHGGSALQRVFRAYRSAPQAYAQSVPPDLVAILRRAMHADAAERFESAAALRDALESFLSHRRGEARVRDADTRVTQLEQAIAQGHAELEVSRAFGAARFALREASDARPDHASLPGLRARLFAGMAAHALDVGRLGAAAAHLAELDPAPAELTARLETLRAAEAQKSAHVARLERLGREQDLDTGSTFRRRALVGGGVVFLVANLVYAALERAGLVNMGYAEIAQHSVLVWIGLGSYVFWKRQAIFQNQANSVLHLLALITFVTIQAYWLCCWELGIDFRDALCLTTMFYVLVSGAVALLISARLWLCPVLAAIGLVVAAVLPEHAFVAIGLSAGTSLAMVGLAWKDGPRGAQAERA